jgi:transposase
MEWACPSFQPSPTLLLYRQTYEEDSMFNVARVGIDLAKDVFHAYAVDERGHQVFSRNVTRRQLRELLATLPPCIVATESCGTAHYWARYAKRFGHQSRIVASHYVSPYRKGNKHDAADAEAICEAAGRPNMRFVPMKDIEQQDVQCLHRVRQRRMKVAAESARMLLSCSKAVLNHAVTPAL